MRRGLAQIGLLVDPIHAATHFWFRFRRAMPYIAHSMASHGTRSVQMTRVQHKLAGTNTTSHASVPLPGITICYIIYSRQPVLTLPHHGITEAVTELHTQRERDTHTHTHTERERGREGERERKRDIHTHTHRERHTHTHTQRETHTHTHTRARAEREREREREKEREREREKKKEREAGLCGTRGTLT